jgi:TRAP-type C4-dicarboxylate transport system substrate-binding protein
MHCTISDRASVVEFVYAPWIAAVEALNGTLGGTFNITVTYGDAPFDATTSLSAISSGVVDIGQLSPDTFHLGGLGYLPWLFPNITSTAYTMHKLLRDEVATWDANGELDGVKILLASPLWPAEYWGHSVNVTTVASIAGLKVRAEGGESVTIQSFNATPVYIATSDLGSALQTHIIEGLFFTYSGIGGFSGVGPNCDYVTELNMFFRPYMLAMNKDVYDALPADARTALDSVCTAAKSVELAAAHLAGMAEDRNATEVAKGIYIPNSTELADWKAATTSVATDWIDYMTDPLGFDGQGIYDRALALIAVSP